MCLAVRPVATVCDWKLWVVNNCVLRLMVMMIRRNIFRKEMGSEKGKELELRLGLRMRMENRRREGRRRASLPAHEVVVMSRHPSRLECCMSLLGSSVSPDLKTNKRARIGNWREAGLRTSTAFSVAML